MQPSQKLTRKLNSNQNTWILLGMILQPGEKLT